MREVPIDGTPDINEDLDRGATVDRGEMYTGRVLIAFIHFTGGL